MRHLAITGEMALTTCTHTSSAGVHRYAVINRDTSQTCIGQGRNFTGDVSLSCFDMWGSTELNEVMGEAFNTSLPLP